ncbi:MAG: urea carboxylase [Gallionellales bacterium 35-53-114]|jgi:urea carboxylase-associated protein 2|nr:MAG: urea carboxylase [Gallionellales bacterium 35-53-114]OYZ63925.1 MAG: urea carboxylase [Gallionellales bacterium 24-53-125]OZB09246.1 MAG: urea carboxylase [Gallionellales bacterium 39-52-133]HQS59152.1 urea carboxylase-associated family protein [Gallionellaceae bacterium]HQS75888.1 urea carboxylase-associated family protein [Gallionellaceae bacterium]
MMHQLSRQNQLWEETIPGAAHWSFQMKRGNALRLTDIEGGANLSVLFYNMEEKLERYNMPDTLKAQHTAHLTKGFVCYSDMGRVLASVIEDSCGWHDTICGMSNAALVEAKYGKADYQQQRNAMHRNARDSMLIELGKWGLGKRDIVPNVNFFSKVSADEAGGLHYQPGHSKAGAYVELRFEMNVLVVLSACQHPLDPATQYSPKPVHLQAWHCGTADADDYCRNFRPENVRGFYNTELLFR